METRTDGCDARHPCTAICDTPTNRRRERKHNPACIRRMHTGRPGGSAWKQFCCRPRARGCWKYRSCTSKAQKSWAKSLLQSPSTCSPQGCTSNLDSQPLPCAPPVERDTHECILKRRLRYPSICCRVSAMLRTHALDSGPRSNTQPYGFDSSASATPPCSSPPAPLPRLRW
jgi:hypothetical protein